jgi:hypothetical protein
MLVMLWHPVDDEPVSSDACFQRLVEEMKGLPPKLTPNHDPVLASLQPMMEHVTEAPEQQQFSRVRARDQSVVGSNVDRNALPEPFA